jgi:flagella basal body P-ring formation protein FlgA
MTFKTLFKVAAFVGLLGVQSSLAAEGFWGAEDIRVAVRNYMASSGKPIDAKVVIGPLDDRMQVPACDGAPDISPRSAYSTSLVVHCSAPHVWTFNIRVDADGNIPLAPTPSTKAMTNGPIQQWHVVVPRVSIPSGTILNASMVEERVTDVPPGGASLKSIEEAIGLRITTAVSPGIALTTRNVARAPTIMKGETVTLSAEGEGFSIETPGRAEEDGYEGDILAVRNVKTGIVITGKVAHAGLVLVH